MEIRARISLEVAKFQASAKIVASQFRAMTGNAETYSKNVDKYIERNLKNRLEAMEQIKRAEQRALSFSNREQQAARPRQGSTQLTFGQGASVQKRVALSYISQITEAERRATAERIVLANKTAAAASAAEQKRYNEWLRINTKQSAEARTFADRQKKANEVAAYFNTDEFEGRLASTRYALYDISRRAALFGTSLAGAFALAAKSAIEFQSSFTTVERTTQLSLTSNIPEVRMQAEELRKTLIQLTTEIPVAFADITQIATLGAQLGIAADDVDNFTETVAKFSAITRISVDDVALSFGRLSQLLDVPAAQFENLSSAIAFTGVNSVATDQEILRMSESIAAAATNAGIAAEDTIGFAAALASLKVRPEEARGVLTRLFREFDISVSQGGSRLDDLAQVVGKTAEDTANLWRQDPSQFVQAFLRGAQATGALNETITSLGITNSRELNVITRLANNMDVLTSAMADSREQFALGTFSTEKYSEVTDDVASKLVTLQNSIAALGDAFGRDFLGPLGGVLDILQDAINTLAKAPAPIKFLIGVVGALAAGFAIFFASLTAGIAGLLALRLAFDNLKGGSIQAGISLNTFRALLISMLPAAGGANTALGAINAQLKATTVSVMGLTVSIRALMLTLGVIGIALTAIGTIATLAASQEDGADSADKLAQANFEAAGGIEAFRKAAKEGGKVYETVGASVKQLTDEQIKQKKEALKARVTQAELTKGTEEGKKEYESAKQELEKFNAQLERTNGLMKTSTLRFTENTKEVIANALAKVQVEGQDAPINIFAEIAQIDPETEQALQAAGTSAAQILNGAIEAAMVGDMSALEYVQDQISNVAPDARNAQGWNDFIKNITIAGNAVDGYIDSAIKANAAAQVQSQVIGNAGLDAEEAAEGFRILNDALRETARELTSGAISEGKVADALDSFAQGAKSTAGEMDGLGVAARENLSNFASFMDAAVEASINAGEGTRGAISRMIAGLEALEDSGVNTADAFVLVRDFAINALIQIYPALNKVKTELSKAPNLAGMKAIINAFYAARIAAEGWSIQLQLEWDRARSLLSGAATDYTVSLGNIDKATARTQTKLEKLQAVIRKTFSWINKRMELQDSINSLGDAIEENGNTFSIWSEKGRDNVNALLAVIDNLAVISNGDAQLFANSLGAMRQALIKTGVTGDALKFIDDALKKTGKTAKVSAGDVDRFYAELADSAAAERSLADVADAVSEVQSAIRKGISAYFAQQNAIDAITLGWLDMADAADNAREAIEDAKDEIEDARQAIKEANASIQELSAQSNTLEYQLQIALKYGDVLRADEIRAELAQIDAAISAEQQNIADANAQITDAQNAMAEAQGNLGIQPTTQQIIEQNQALQNMALLYGDAAAWMLITAEEGADLNAIIEDQVSQFYNNALQMGYTQEQASAVADVLRQQLIAEMNKIPKDITTEISAETSAALAKVTKFANDANARLNTIRDKTITVTTVYRTVGVPGGGGGGYMMAASGGYVSGPGTGTSDSIPARLSNGEYVIRAAAVNRYGVDFFNAVNQMRMPSSSSLSTSISTAGAAQTVYLSPEDRQLLRQAIDRPIALYTDNATIARSANDGNAILAQRGIR